MTLGLPRILGITPGLADLGAVVGLIPEALSLGMQALQVRDHGLSPEELGRCAAAIRKEHPRLPLLLNGPPAIAAAHGLAGVHHPDFDPAGEWLRQLAAHPRLLFTMAAHGEEGLRRAAALKADAALLAPVLPPRTKPLEGACLGWRGFAGLASRAGLPVYALGGMDAGGLKAAQAHQAHGIALCGGLFSAGQAASAEAGSRQRSPRTYSG